MTYPKPKFNLGKIEITLFAKLAMERSGQSADEFLNKHRNGNYGEVTTEEKIKNDELAKNNKGKILSAYVTSFNNETLWIVTDLETKTTKVMLPREYDLEFDK